MGEVYVDRISISAAEVEALGSIEWRGPRGVVRTLRVRRARDTHDKMLTTFEGFASREAVSALTNGELWIEPERLPQPGEGAYYAFQLVGLALVDGVGRTLGRVKDVVTVADRSMIVLDAPGEPLVPAHAPFVKSVDLAAGVITMDLPPGFEELLS